MNKSKKEVKKLSLQDKMQIEAGLELIKESSTKSKKIKSIESVSIFD